MVKVAGLRLARADNNRETKPHLGRRLSDGKRKTPTWADVGVYRSPLAGGLFPESRWKLY
jgi:hypothetical protein